MTTFWSRHAIAACRRAPNAKPITVGRVATVGPVTIEDRVITDSAGDQRLARVTLALVPTADFATVPTRHTAAVVDGTEYSIRDVRKIEDGDLLELTLALELA